LKPFNTYFPGYFSLASLNHKKSTIFNPSIQDLISKPSDALEVLLGRAVADHGDVLRHIGPTPSRKTHGMFFTVIFHGDPMVIEW
jgi:hypothetical protein